MPEELEAVHRTYDLMMWTLDRIESFPKTYRIPLGGRMRATMHDVLDLLGFVLRVKSGSGNILT